MNDSLCGERLLVPTLLIVTDVVTELSVHFSSSSVSLLSMASPTTSMCSAKLRSLIFCQPPDLDVGNFHVELLPMGETLPIHRERVKPPFSRWVIPIVRPPRPGASEALHPDAFPQSLFSITPADVRDISSQGRVDVAREIIGWLAEEVFQAEVHVPRLSQ